MSGADTQAMRSWWPLQLLLGWLNLVLTAPVIQSELGARFQITGFKTTAETKDLSLLLRAGALAQSAARAALASECGSLLPSPADPPRLPSVGQHTAADLRRRRQLNGERSTPC